MKGKVFITGICTGLGRLIVQDLLKKNYLIIGVDIQEAEEFTREIEAGKLIYFKKDLRKTGQIPDFLGDIWNRFQGIDIVINNAAVLNFAYLEKLEYDMIDEMLKVNLQSPIIILKFFLEKMQEADSGKIINISSRSAFRGKETTSIYASTKAGLNRFHQVILREKKILNKQSKVTINTLCPDRIATPEFLTENPKVKARKLIQPEKIFSIIEKIINSGIDGKLYRFHIRYWRRVIRETINIKKIPGLRWIANL